MTAAKRAYAYLQIPAEYGGTLGGLVWSSSGDAIERWNGTTFAFAEEIRDVIDGAFAAPRVPPFEFVLSLLHTMRDGPGSGAPNRQRLHHAFTATKGVPRLLWHAGRLIAELCSTLPSAAYRPPAEDVMAAVGRCSSNDWILSEVSPLPRDEFVRRIEERLAQFDDDRLRHWLKFGCEPLREPEKLSEPLDSLPVRVEKLLTLARREPRLMGAASLVPALDGALTLPARRRSPEAVPQGGYCDVTTRGEPDRLLPSQFALDPDEFIRRFAERELLYFQREEPHATRRPERLIVLDQGVRTWGCVRLALAAAALVFMRKEAKRVGRVFFATTSAPKAVDVQEADVESLVQSLESSDLTAHPAECVMLARMRDDAETPRDVVLLTHRRALLEPKVQTILTEAAAEDRVFALAVDDSGAAELVHWRESGPDVVRRFRTDLVAATALGVPAEPKAKQSEAFNSHGWTGDVEPVPFPFRPGLVLPIERMGFDADGEWLVAAGRYGVLQALGLEGEPPEVLPRAFRDGVVLKTIEAVLGVPGGVVVCGRMSHHASRTISSHSVGQAVAASSASDFTSVDRFVAVHYDRKSRRVKLHDLGGPCEVPGTWAAHPELNCISLSLPNDRGAAVDLASHVVRTGPGESGVPRVDVAQWRARNGQRTPPHELRIVNLQTHKGPITFPMLQIVGNGLDVCLDGSGDHHRVMPMRDGQFLLAGGNLPSRAIAAGNTLAVTQKRGGGSVLIVIDCPGNRILGEVPMDADRDRFALSRDGRMIAYTRSRFRTLTIAPVGECAVPRVEVRAAALHDKLQLAFDDKDVLRIGIGEHVHTFRIQNGSMRHTVMPGAMTPAAGTTVNAETMYDWDRFPSKESAAGYAWTAVADRLGQVLVYRKSGTLAASILVRRNRAAAWCPGGIFWGEQSLIGGPPTPHAAEAIAMFGLKREAT